MKMLVAYIRHEAFEAIRADLLEAGFPSLTISEVKGSGRQKAITEHYRGSELAVHLRPKLKLEVVVETVHQAEDRIRFGLEDFPCEIERADGFVHWTPTLAMS